MKKLFLLIVLVFSSTILSGCNTDAGDLFTQALKSNVSVAETKKSGTKVSGSAPVLEVNINGYGKVLTTKRYMPLYTKSEDTSTESTCYDECAIAWPPLVVNSVDDVGGDYGVLERTDEILQVTRLGKPLYSYVPDKPRKITGDGYRGVWSVVILKEEVVE